MVEIKTNVQYIFMHMMILYTTSNVLCTAESAVLLYRWSPVQVL